MVSGVIIVMFDIPVETQEGRKTYSKFINQIKREGYVMLQKSVYYKQIRNIKLSKYNLDALNDNLNESCNVKSIIMTQKQFERIQIISGEPIELCQESTIII